MAAKNESATRDAANSKVIYGQWFHPSRWFRRRAAANTGRATHTDGDAWRWRWQKAATAFLESELAQAEAEELAEIETLRAAARADAAEKGKHGREAVHGETSPDAEAAVNRAERARRG